jgi:hypothetical protein
MKKLLLAVVSLGVLAFAQSAPKPSLERVWGGNAADTLNGLVVDSKGNLITVGDSKSFADTFYGDLLVTKLSPNGDLLWAKNIGTPGLDSPLRYLDGENGSTSRAIAIDSQDSLYLVARSAWKINAEPTTQVVVKLSENGDVLWSKAWRPHWRNQANGATAGSSLAVVGNRVFVAGGGGDAGDEAQILVSILDATTGNQLDALTIDPTPGSNDRVYGLVVSPNGASLYLGGWNGRTARGQILKLNVSSDKLELVWAKEVPQEVRGSTIADLDLDASGNLYAASDVHGTQTYLELFKFSPDGQIIWGQRYNAGVRNDRNNARVVRVIGNKVYLGGRVGYQENTQADYQFGDSVVLVYNLDGKLEREMYHFTGTNRDVLAMDHAMGIATFGNRLYVAGWIFPAAANVAGEWRDPNNYKFAHESSPVPASVQTNPIDNVKTLRITGVAQKTGEEIGLKSSDVKARIELGTPKEMSSKTRSTQFYLFAFDDLLGR